MSTVVSCKLALPGAITGHDFGNRMGRLHGVLVLKGQATAPFSLTRVSTTGGFNRNPKEMG